MNIHDFVKDLKTKKKLFKQKQVPYIDYFSIYIKNLTVYKVAMFVNPLTFKNQGKRCGLKDLIVIWDKGFNEKLKIDLDGVDKGKYLIIYDPKTLESSVYTGEDDEIASVKDLGVRRNKAEGFRFR